MGVRITFAAHSSNAVMGWYKGWFGTRYYALLYGHRDERDARAWVDAILGYWSLPPGSRILDMACGRGRHVKWFRERGMAVSGIDISEGSIAEARIQLPDVDLQVHDMREPFAQERYDAVVCLFTSLGYFDSVDDDRAVLHAAYTALRPGGVFVIDFMNTPRVLHELVPQQELEREGVRFRLTRTLEEDTIVKRIQVQDGDLQQEYEERVQALLPEVIEALCKEAGFELVDRTDGPILQTYSEEFSDRCVLWFKRPDT